MCGRYTLAGSPDALLEEFGPIPLPAEVGPRYNVAPSQEVLAVVGADGGPRTGFIRWGLIPSWSDGPGRARPLINARSETVDRKPSFRESFHRRRCAVLADGFYEWRKTAEGKIPMRIRRTGERPFAFAGLWDVWRPRGGDPGGVEGAEREEERPLHTCAILTTEAAPAIRDIHDRMPVMLTGPEAERWIDPDADPAELRALLRPYGGGDLEAYEVSSRVNRPANDDPDCIDPV